MWPSASPASGLEFRERRTSPWAWGVALAGLVLAGTAGVDAWHANQAHKSAITQLSRSQSRLAKIQEDARQGVLSADSARSVGNAETEALRALGQQLTVAWPEWISAIDTAARGEIWLASLTLDVDGRSADIKGESKSFSEVADLVERLIAADSVREARVVEHRVLESRPGALTSFRITVHFK